MNRAIIGALLLTLTACSQPSETEKSQFPLDTDKAKLGYAMGMDAGLFFRQMNNDADAEAFMAGFRDATEGEKPRLTLEDAKKVKESFMTRKKKEQQEKMAKAQATGEANKKSGAAFLAANKQRDNIKTTSSGLQYEVISPAKGDKPKATDTVMVHYRGTLIDGTEFDSSYRRGEPATFPLNRVIPGWTEGVQLMNVGSKYRFYVPSELGYGERGAGPKIGPNAVLIFEVELLEIVNDKDQGKK